MGSGECRRTQAGITRKAVSYTHLDVYKRQVLDFERSVLNRVPDMEAHPDRHFREVLFMCDEYQHFATVGESEPTGDEKFFSLSRQPKCIPIAVSYTHLDVYKRQH